MSERVCGFDKIIGQELAKRVLRKAACSGNPAHAYIFLGPEGIGKLTTAVEFAKALNCESPNDGSPCCDCAICRTIDQGNLPDVRVWSPEGKNTRIDLMREMRELSALKPMRARWKVNIIEQGDTLNEEAANCILKLIEEPPDFLVNILLYRSPVAVLPTIWSRCSVVRFVQVSTEELADRLVSDYGIDREQAHLLASYAQGCPGRAVRLIGNSQFVAQRDTIARVADAISRRKCWASLKLAEDLRAAQQTAEDVPTADDAETFEEAGRVDDSGRTLRLSARESTIRSLDMLLTWFGDLLAVKVQGQQASVVNMDRRAELQSQADRYRGVEELLLAIESIQQCRRRVVGNANPQVACEALIIQLAGERMCV
ncbi:MAG: hypothetical protein QHI38_12580 [Armatimonadota bacterium]|nr:hypothetical protein [Armatimonadota bacterium]